MCEITFLALFGIFEPDETPTNIIITEIILM